MKASTQQLYASLRNNIVIVMLLIIVASLVGGFLAVRFSLMLSRTAPTEETSNAPVMVNPSVQAAEAEQVSLSRDLEKFQPQADAQE